MEGYSDETDEPLQRAPILIAGGGFLGSALAARLHGAGVETWVLTRSEASARALRAELGVVALACDFPAPGALEETLGERRFSAVVACASSGSLGESREAVEAAYRRIYEEGTRQLLRYMGEAAQPRFLFVSSTSVYAQTDGTTVTEESETLPERETGRILLAAERLALDAGGVVARLGGLYGPGRWAARDRVVEGTARLEGDGSRWINLIHRDDAAEALILLLHNSDIAGIYNVTDGTPISQRELYTALARAYALPVPPPGPLLPGRKRGWSHKRVAPIRLARLGWRPQHSPISAAVASAAAAL